MSTTAAPAVPAQEDTGKRTLLVGSVMLATLMQALDTTIANVSLPTLPGNLGSSSNQATCVPPPFAVSTALPLPLPRRLGPRLRDRKLLLWSTDALVLVWCPSRLRASILAPAMFLAGTLQIAIGTFAGILGTDMRGGRFTIVLSVAWFIASLLFWCARQRRNSKA